MRQRGLSMELDHEAASEVAGRINEVDAYAAVPPKRSCCACFCRYWPMGVTATPFLIIMYFVFVFEEGGARIALLVWLHVYTACVWFFTNSTLDGINRYLCPASHRFKARDFFLVKALVAFVTGAVLFGAGSMVLLGGEDSDTWYEEHRQMLQEQVPNVHALGDPVPPAYIITSGENGYRADLVDSLRSHGASADNIHYVPAVMADTCKIVGEAGRAEMHRSFIFGVVGLVRNILLGDLCYDSCMFRCFGERFCPLESSPDKYQTIACQAPPIAPYRPGAGQEDSGSRASHGSSEAAVSSNNKQRASVSDSGDIPATRLARAARRLAEVDDDVDDNDDKSTDDEDASGIETGGGSGSGSGAGAVAGAQATKEGTAFTASGEAPDASQTRTLRSPAASGESNRNLAESKPASARPSRGDAASSASASASASAAASASASASAAAAAAGIEEETETQQRRVPGVTSPKVTNSMGLDVIDAAEAGDSAFDVRVNASNTFLHRADAIRELAVAASHLKAIHTAYLAGEEYALILEDDASLSLVPLWHNVGLREAMMALPHDWHVLQLHVWLGGEMGIGATIVDKMLHRLAVGQIVSRRHPVHDAEFWGAVAYAVSRKGMRAILDRYWGAWDADKGRGAVTLPPTPPEHLHRQAHVTTPFDDPHLPFLDLTANPLSDVIVYSTPNTYVVNRPLFSHQLGGKHWTRTHTSGLHRHEDDRKRLLHFFYEGYDANKGNSIANDEDVRFFMQLSNMWLFRTADALLGNVAYFLDPFALLLYVVYANFFYVPVAFYYQSGRGAPPCCCDERTGEKLGRMPAQLSEMCRPGGRLAKLKAHVSPSPSLQDLTELPTRRNRGYSA